ncbi:LYR motif-containing protein 1 isoform X1 [Trichosurus vulpecula]|uniref:LYR motif-containing protein 1 isoform X1 n=1 Tax=Trichosurus vulpecula TaxID=9337 RepID=UPI00186B0EC7|nr:LYR motif-containing protein 1 isoform X1 [Trichosurus vulpecula]
MESAVGSLGLEAGSAEMTTATRQEVLSLYRRIFRLARRWHAASGQMEDTIREKQYIINEARSLFQKNKNPELVSSAFTSPHVFSPFTWPPRILVPSSIRSDFPKAPCVVFSSPFPSLLNMCILP